MMTCRHDPSHRSFARSGDLEDHLSFIPCCPHTQCISVGVFGLDMLVLDGNAFGQFSRLLLVTVETLELPDLLISADFSGKFRGCKPQSLLFLVVGQSISLLERQPEVTNYQYHLRIVYSETHFFWYFILHCCCIDASTECGKMQNSTL